MGEKIILTAKEIEDLAKFAGFEASRKGIGNDKEAGDSWIELNK